MNWKWFLLAVVLTSCDDYSECGVTDYSEDIYFNFYYSSDSTARKVEFDSMNVFYLNEGSFMFQDTVGAFGYILPLDMTSKSTSFLFSTDSTDYDLTIGYVTQARIENPDCGPIFRVTAITAQSNEFDSVAVVVKELSKNLAPHVKIYF